MRPLCKLCKASHLLDTYSDYTLSEAWSGVNWADLMAAQGAFGTDFYDRSIYSVQNIVPTIVLVDLSMRSAQFSPLQASDRV